MKALLGLPEPSLQTAILYKWHPVSCLDLTLLSGKQAPPPPPVAWAISQTLFSVSDPLFSCSLKALVVHSSLSSLQILFMCLLHVVFVRLSPPFLCLSPPHLS